MHRSLLVAAPTLLALGAPLAAQTPPPAPAPAAMTRDSALAAADRRFDTLDANRDGRVTADEMRAARPNRGGPPRADGDRPAPPPPGGPGRMAPRLERMDANRDGVVDRAEFRAAALARFDAIDRNRDGRIDPSERAAMRDRWAGRGREGAD